MTVGSFYPRTDWLANKPLEILIPPDGYPLFSMVVTLDGRDYTFGFKYAAREDRWYLSIFDSAGKTLVTGLKVIADWPLLRRQGHVAGIPPGNLLAQDYSGAGDPPGRYDWGLRVHLLYYPATAPT